MLEGYQAARDRKKTDKRCSTDWKLVAMVLDRFLLIVFTLLTVGVSLGLLLNHPAYSMDAESLDIVK